jgi:hypothetical protein
MTASLGDLMLPSVSTTQLLNVEDSLQRTQIANYCVWIFGLSSSLLIPLAIGLSVIGILKRLLSTKQNAISEEKDANHSSVSP